MLDVNVLIALLDPLHVHHERAHHWFAGHGRQAWLSSPTTQNGVLRIVSHPGYPNHSPLPVVVDSLRSLLAVGHHTFVADSVSLLDGSIQAGRLTASAQVTDSYLLALAASHRAYLATFDRKMVVSAIAEGAKVVLQIP